MLDTFTVLAYMIGHGYGHSNHLQLKAQFPAGQFTSQSTKRDLSPALQWRGVSPEAGSVAVLLKDKTSSSKTKYDWVLYNLPIWPIKIPMGGSHKINRNNVGYNSWGKVAYHNPYVNQNVQVVSVSLYALDRRFTANDKMTGEQLIKKMKGHVLEKASISFRK